MTLGSMIALFGTMLILASIPSSSVLIVISRSAASGFIHGVCTTLGIVTGDVVFIMIAIFGLSILAESMGDLFVIVRYLGGAYLIWMGTGLWKTGSVLSATADADGESLLASYMGGLLFTLADQKAILFYLGFFPAFVNLSSLTLKDTGIILLITLVAVGGVKTAYAYMANHAVSIFSLKIRRKLNFVAGCLMMTIGLYIVITA